MALGVDWVLLIISQETGDKSVNHVARQYKGYHGRKTYSGCSEAYKIIGKATGVLEKKKCVYIYVCIKCVCVFVTAYKWYDTAF